MIHEHPNIKFPCLRTFVYHAQNGDWCTTVGEIECFRPHGSRKTLDKPAEDAKNHNPMLLIDDLPEDVRSGECKKFAQMDTVHSGSKESGGVLTMALPTDKHQAFIRKLTDFRQETIHKALRSIRRECEKQGIEIDHILTDNGSEFLDEKTIGGIFGPRSTTLRLMPVGRKGLSRISANSSAGSTPKAPISPRSQGKKSKLSKRSSPPILAQPKPRKEPKMRIFSVWPRGLRHFTCILHLCSHFAVTCHPKCAYSLRARAYFRYGHWKFAPLRCVSAEDGSEFDTIAVVVPKSRAHDGSCGKFWQQKAYVMRQLKAKKVFSAGRE